MKIKVGRRTPELLEKRAAAAAGKTAAGKKKLAAEQKKAAAAAGKGDAAADAAEGAGAEPEPESSDDDSGSDSDDEGREHDPDYPSEETGTGGVLRRGDGGGVPEAGAAAPRGAGGAAQVRRGEDFGGEQGGRRRVARGEVRGRGRARRFGQLMRDTERGIGDERRVFDLDTSRVIVSIVLDVHSSTATPLKAHLRGRPSLIRDVVLALVDVFLHNLGVLAVDGAAGGFRGAEDFLDGALELARGERGMMRAISMQSSSEMSPECFTCFHPSCGRGGSLSALMTSADAEGTTDTFA